MTGANMNLVTVNVKLGENDEDPQQHLDEVSLNPHLETLNRLSFGVWFSALS
jgi:hypothetical protein